jgi:DNA repair exonuclease SbcCD ATPase subunit
MELLELTLKKYKRFSDAAFRFSPGLTVFWGNNEAGKSTIFEAICSAFYGRERGKILESWSGGNCSVALSYRADGKNWRVERRLTEGAASLGSISGDETADVTSTRDEITRILAEQLGTSSRSVLENTVFVKQLYVKCDDRAGLEAVGGEIQRILTGTAHISAAEVRNKLEDKRDAVKGRARPTNPREYDQVTSRLGEVAAELADARHSRELIQNSEEELSQLEERAERDSARLDVVTRLLDQHKKWSELKKRLEDLESRHAEVFGVCRQIKNALNDLADIQKQLEDFADLVGKDDEIADQLQKIQSRQGELDSRLGELRAVYPEAQPISGRFKSVLALASAVLIAGGIVLGLLVDHLWLWLVVPGAVLGVISALRLILGRATESRHIGDMISNAESERSQLDGELGNILTYVSCADADQAWARIKSYRSLAARSNESELKLGAVLSSKTSQDWEAQESELAREVSTSRAELEADFAGYSPSTEESERWRGEYMAIQQQLPRIEARVNELRGSLEAERRNSRDLAALEGEIEYLHTRKRELEFTYDAYGEAIAALSTVTQDVSEEYLPGLSERASQCLAWVTSGRYTGIEIRPGWEVSAVMGDRTGIVASNLSVGALDQLYFSLRIACGEMLSSGRHLPMILDDPFAAFDRERLTNVLSLIAALSRERQIILLTHDLYTLDWARTPAASGDPECLIYELPSNN